jgi:hypothetical protein
MDEIIFKCIELIISALMLIVTIVIARFAMNLTERQLKVQELQLKHDLYERRFQIYNDLTLAYGDYNDHIYLKSIKDRCAGINQWLNINEDHIQFLFEETVLQKAKKLRQELGNADPEYFKENPNKEIVQKLKDYYEDLKNEISSVLSFRNLM